MDSPPKFIYRANRDKSSKIQFCCNFSQVDLKLYLAWTAHFLKNSGMSVELAITTLDFIRVEGERDVKIPALTIGLVAVFVGSLGSLSNRVF